MIHPSTELRFINNEIGYGVFTTEFIPKGTLVWALDKLDRQFSGLEMLELGEPYQQILSRYCYRDNQGHFVLCWDNGRYVNHSFHANCMSTAYDCEIAIRDIQPGEELTDDYGYLNLMEPFRARDEGARRKYVYPNDLVKYHKIWDKKLMSAFKHFSRVQQPLQRVMSPEMWDHCVKVSCGEEPMASIVNIYFDQSVSIEAGVGSANG
ncbi:MAG: SET domain-containing protein [Pseudomonadales bacterium]|jgi:hypothetical protein